MLSIRFKILDTVNCNTLPLRNVKDYYVIHNNNPKA